MYWIIFIEGATISRSLQQTFMDNLLSTYRELERSFMRNIYELHKAFEFRTLWEGNNPLTSFQRVASESARGTGRLNGMVQLTGVLKETKKLQYKAVKCFTNNIYTTNIQKWSYDNVKDKEVSCYTVHFIELSIDINTQCYKTDVNPYFNQACMVEYMVHGSIPWHSSFVLLFTF